MPSYIVEVTQTIGSKYRVIAESKEEARDRYCNGLYEELHEDYDNETEIEVYEEN